MFVRQKKNASGKVSVQIIDKSSGKYQVIHTVGCGVNEEEILKLMEKGNQWIGQKTAAMELDFTGEQRWVQNVLDSIQSLDRVGYDLLLGPIFDEIGFNRIRDAIFRELVIARVTFPKSKLKTTQFLYRYKNIAWDEDQLYRYLDKLYHTQKELVQQISYEHTLRIMNHDISVVFYDVTTLYFEIDQEDDLRKTGFSKEGKHQNPQIVLGLLVSKNGYPLAYEIFEGNKFEGHTMLPVIDRFKEKFHLEKLVVIADSGLLSRSNIDQLQEKGYEFIIGARIKNESSDNKRKILSLNLGDGQSEVIQKGDLKLIITHSDSRAKKDRYNREKGIRKLARRIRTGHLTKSDINNRGYNKFLQLKGDISVTLDQSRITEDSLWDGLKGYLTNARLPKNQIIESYQELWQIEKAFRIAKSDLKIRPVYHRLQRRIEAHICISFVAYKVYKELERQLKEKKASISALQAIEIADNIHQITIAFNKGQEQITKLLLITEEQKYLARLCKF
ncbi:MAG: IS1634 family transposase [Bacteroidota bacterium]|nr:IS1634 family transposase [Bacteroidota bacterium]